MKVTRWDWSSALLCDRPRELRGLAPLTSCAGARDQAFPRASILVTGVQDLDTRAHGPNEGLHLPEFERAVLAGALLLQHLGDA